MMTKTTSKKRVWCYNIALIPLFIAAIFVFSTKIIAQDNATATSSEATTVANEQQIIFPAKGAAPELLAEFETIISKYREDEKWISTDFSEEESARLYVIYVQMDTAQRAKQWLHFVSPLVPDIYNYLTQKQWSSYNKPHKEDIEIWLNGEKVEHSALAAYTRSDISLFYLKFTPTKKYINLWTKKEHKDYLQQYSQQISVAKLLEIPLCPRFSFKKEELSDPNSIWNRKHEERKQKKWSDDL